ARDLEGITRAINAGLNGLADRRERYNRALSMGDRLMPPKGDWFSMATKGELEAVVYECLKVYMGPNNSDTKDIRFQLTGSRDSIPGDPQDYYTGFEKLVQTSYSATLPSKYACNAIRWEVA